MVGVHNEAVLVSKKLEALIPKFTIGRAHMVCYSGLLLLGHSFLKAVNETKSIGSYIEMRYWQNIPLPGHKGVDSRCSCSVANISPSYEWSVKDGCQKIDVYEGFS